MKKIVKRIGNSLGIILDKEDCKINGLELGDVIEIEIRKKLGNIKEAKLE